jgi:predicted DNA-binding transcriptional regulator YafY
LRRADRLFRIVQLLRGGRLMTAQRLGERLEVSPRTIYRDIADLAASGVPIEGEAGVGYILRAGFDLPPLMFSRDEIVALTVGARMVRAFGGAAMARAAEEALVKVGAVVPQADRARIEATEIHAPALALPQEDRIRIDRIERAVEARDALVIEYRDEKGAQTRRAVRPLGLWFWGKVWTLVAWCELRDDFRVFRVDRIGSLGPAGRKFRIERGRTLADFYRSIESKTGELPLA